MPRLLTELKVVVFDRVTRWIPMASIIAGAVISLGGVALGVYRLAKYQVDIPDVRQRLEIIQVSWFLFIPLILGIGLSCLWLSDVLLSDVKWMF